MFANLNITVTTSQFLGSGTIQAELGGIMFLLTSVGMGGERRSLRVMKFYSMTFYV